MKPVKALFNRPCGPFGDVRRLYFVRRDATVAVPVESPDECARFFDEFLACDLALLVFVKITANQRLLT